MQAAVMQLLSIATVIISMWPLLNLSAQQRFWTIGFTVVASISTVVSAGIYHWAPTYWSPTFGFVGSTATVFVILQGMVFVGKIKNE
jgi:hypothetical protein